MLFSSPVFNSLILRVRYNSGRSQLVRMAHSQPMTNVFVYGTLKKGEPNHYLLEDSKNGVSNFLFKARTKSKYPLVVGPPYNIPYMIDVESTGFNVCGEVYEVDDKMLAVLDDLEQHPNVYKRRKENVLYKEGEAEKCFDNAWAYFYQRYTTEMLKLPMLESYSSKNCIYNPYIPRNMRQLD